MSQSLKLLIVEDNPTNRLVATGIPLLGSGGADVRRRCEAALERGPGPVSVGELEA